MLGNGVGRVGRDLGDRDPELGGGIEIDVVEAGRAERDEMRPAVSEPLQDGPVEPVVYEGAHRGESRDERHGPSVESGFEVDELAPECLTFAASRNSRT